MKKSILSLLFLSSVMPALFAAAPQIGVRVDPGVIGMNEQATLTLELDRPAQNIAPVGGRDFDLQYAGESHNSQVTVINGVVQSKNSYVYSYILIPRKTGLFDIGQFEVTIDKQKYKTAPQNLKIKVVRQSQRKAANPADPFAQIDEFFNGRNRVPEIAFRLVPRPQTAFQNQQVLLEGYLESPDRAAFDFQFSQVADIRSDKCALFDISASLKPSVQKTGGVYRKLVKRYVIFPVETGKIGIAPPNIIAMTPYGQIQLKSEVIGIESMKLNDRSGLSYVGDLQIRFSLSSNRIETGKNCEITLTMTGNGNLKALSNPYGDLDLEGVFLSAPSTETRFTEMRGNKAYFQQVTKYLLMTKKPGIFAVPSLVIRYYDDRGNPKTFEIKSFTVESVEKEQIVHTEKLALKPLEKPRDFRFLLFSPLILALIACFALLPLAAAVYGSHLERMETDPDYARKFLAGKRLSGYFAQAEKKLKENDLKGFYTSAQNGIFYYLTDKLNLPAGSGYRDIAAVMRERNISPDAAALFEKVYRECAHNAFSGVAEEGKPAEILDQIHRLIELTK